MPYKIYYVASCYGECTELPWSSMGVRPFNKVFELGKPRKPSKILSQIRYKILVDNNNLSPFAASSIAL